jgi:hypothetical protein
MLRDPEEDCDIRHDRLASMKGHIVDHAPFLCPVVVVLLACFFHRGEYPYRSIIIYGINVRVMVYLVKLAG